MQHSLSFLKNFTVITKDGIEGIIHHFYFDVYYWAIRYLYIGINNSAYSKNILLSPANCEYLDFQKKVFYAEIRRNQVESAPYVSAQVEIDRELEVFYNRVFDLVDYWKGVGVWSHGMDPHILLGRGAGDEDDIGTDSDEQKDLLLKTKDIKEYTVVLQNRHYGRVQDFIIDEKQWRIVYLVIQSIKNDKFHFLIEPYLIDMFQPNQKQMIITF